MAAFSKPAKPATVVGRYLRYKAGTKLVIEWLARTADRVGDLKSCLDCLKPKTSKTKLSKTDIETIRIKTHELKKLAEIIANSDPRVGVPRDVLRVLEDVIAGRQACAGWYASQAIDDATELASQNESHAHFIGVLKQIQAILRPAMCLDERQEPSRPMSGKKGVSVGNIPSNLFNVLDVQESFEGCSESEDSPVYRQAQKAKKSKKKSNTTASSKAKTTPESFLDSYQVPTPKDDSPPPYTASYPDAVFQMEQSEESDAFALWCHLADLNDVRVSVKSTWIEYAEGKITLDVAGVITETAFGMMRRTHEEFIAVKPRFVAYDGAALFLGLRMAFNNNVVYTFSNNPLAKAAEAQSEAKQADLICAAAGLHLRMFREACQMSLRSALTHNIEWSSQPYPTNLIGSRPKTDFEATAFSFVPELTARVPGERRHSRHRKEKHYHTHFTDELTTLVPLNSEPIEPPIWLVVATQTCMDIHDAVDIACGPTTLTQAADLAKQISLEYLKFHEQPDFARMSTTADKDCLAGISSRWTKVTSAIVPGKPGDLKGAFKDRLYFPGLRVLPHFAGEVNYSMKISMHDLGTKLANDDDAVITMAHPYKAARKYGLVTENWHDLDVVIANHSNKRPLITKTKANADAFAIVRNFLLDVGVQEPSQLPDKMPPKAFKVARGLRKTSIDATDSDFMTAMLEQYRDEEKAKLSRDGKLEAVLSALAARSKSSRGSSHESRRLTPTELLVALQDELIAAETRLNFDYIGFSRTCMALLAQFTEAGMSKTPDHDGNQEGPAAAYYLLKGIASVDADSESELLSDTSPALVHSNSIIDTPFAAGAAVLQRSLSEISKKYCQVAFNSSSGRLRKESRPAPAPHPEKVVSEAAIQNLLEKLGPGASISSSRRTIEIYDPTGNVEKLDHIFNTRIFAPFIRPLMPDGISKDIRIVIQESGEDWKSLAEGYSHPQLNMIDRPLWNKENRSEDYIDYDEALELERKRREHVFR